ncbi:MAG: 2-C-methyl-D-erythritol 4-phosphate cytidylyltransferase [Bacteroidetes bacterium]|nr:MAG: 2-C-methyl-D-erythritol 4-phosphate cytidylyltransferase [Bacteroidota bacterium]
MVQGKNVGVVIPAAGSGTRFGGGVAKQFLELNGESLLSRTVKQFQIHPAVDSIAIACSNEGLELTASIVRNIQATKVVWIGLGGLYRQDSVRNALQHLATDIVLVHDAARPFVSGEIIDRVLNGVIEFGAAIPVVPPKDTLKISTGDMLVKSTPPRETLWLAQTPQGFMSDILKRAFHYALQNHFIGTDDASLVEQIGVPVKLVEGDVRNFKITTPEDLLLASLLAK